MSIRSLVPNPGAAVDFVALRDLISELRELDSCPQDPEWHAEGNVGRHTRMVVEWLVGSSQWALLSPDDRASTFFAALLHDIGKPLWTRIDEGRITSRGHSRHGSLLTRRLLWQLALPFSVREAACAIVSLHQLPLLLIDGPDARRRAITASYAVRLDLLALVAEADAWGRQCRDRQALVDNVDLFREACREWGICRTPHAFASDHARFLYFREPSRALDAPAWDDTWGEVTLMSGLPASGKDSWLSRNVASLPAVSLDVIRDRLGAPRTGDQGRVIQEARTLARTFLRAREPFAWNATALSRQVRSAVIEFFASYGARIHVVYVEASRSLLLTRNRDRARPVPPDALEKLFDRWEVPDLTEAHRVTHAVM